MLPSATQSLTKTGLIRRSAKCPVHDKQSSEFLGSSYSGYSSTGIVTWKFRCTALTQKGVKADHIFAARADPHVPRTVEESLAWVLAQKQKQARVYQ